MSEEQNVATSVTQQVSLLNFRLSDFIRELNVTIKVLLEENENLRKENKELKNKKK